MIVRNSKKYQVPYTVYTMNTNVLHSDSCQNTCDENVCSPLWNISCLIYCIKRQSKVMTCILSTCFYIFAAIWANLFMLKIATKRTADIWIHWLRMTRGIKYFYVTLRHISANPLIKPRNLRWRLFKTHVLTSIKWKIMDLCMCLIFHLSVICRLRRRLIISELIVFIICSVGNTRKTAWYKYPEPADCVAGVSDSNTENGCNLLC